MNRRDFLKQITAVSLSYAAINISGCSASLSRSSGRKPNVIYILTDDQGTIDMNCYGAKDLYTPNMDKLASEGSRFTQFYAASPICSPSRAAFLSGKTPQAAGMPGNAPSSKGNAGMPSSTVTISEVMKSAGYKTAHIGKWHLGYSEDTMPNAQGFDYSFGHMGGCIDNYSHFFYWYGPNRHDLHENREEVFLDGEYFPDLMTEKALEYINENSGDPFFLYFAFNLPHYPVQPAPKWRDYYKNLPEQRRDYAAFVSTIDERIGILIDEIERLGLKNDTIFVLQSDHGHSTEERCGWGGGSAGIHRGAKFSLFEGGIKVPAIISWPGKLPRNQVINQPAFEVDWLPTIADLCGIRHEIRELDGKSLKGMLKDPHSPNQHEHYVWQIGEQWAVRKGDWKLIGNAWDTSSKETLDDKIEPIFLVNLSEDPEEKTNLADKKPQKVNELISIYKNWKYANPEFIRR
ncbi:Arylsulfatase [Limihaloglobus sulfuriphilus]|uniref:Arylsulfatase n=1 Tax=Limihaloglobus sulfuriphilus TaxID=1851148 RepID=A0A1Q2MBS1_9BACT|nr:sulfatase-like hydrolase/transferase [Limihaloglobus sulfuriphilus]AQQ70131.1 Arylsulfatase [Limihaloglobus sulfuriphilus]